MTKIFQLPALKIRRLCRTAASAYLKDEWGISRTPKTLAKYAVTGGGPDFEKAGRDSLYTPPNLDKYAISILSPVVSSSSEFKSWKASKKCRTEDAAPPCLESKKPPKKVRNK